MSEPIKVGDLVQVVHTCCDYAARQPIFTVGAFDTSGRPCRCVGCNHWVTGQTLARVNEGPRGLPLPWLKRIPPFPELADEKHDEELTA
jgi:hypothetical protein